MASGHAQTGANRTHTRPHRPARDVTSAPTIFSISRLIGISPAPSDTYATSSSIIYQKPTDASSSHAPDAAEQPLMGKAPASSPAGELRAAMVLRQA